MPCKMPGCIFHSQENGWCAAHKGFAVEDDIPIKKAYRIPKKSKKRAKTDKVYSAIVNKMIEENPTCEVKSPDCTFFATGANHKQKRSPANLIDKDNLERCCNECNLYIELNVQWAIDNGHQISRFKK